MFPEHVQATLAESRDEDILKFKLAVETTSSFDQRLVIAVEHRLTTLSPTDETESCARYRRLLLEGLLRFNHDFRESYRGNPGATEPIVRVHARGTGPFAVEDGIKHRYLA